MRLVTTAVSGFAFSDHLRTADMVELVQVGIEALPPDCEEAIPCARPPLAVDIGKGQRSGEVLRRLVETVARRLEFARTPRPGAEILLCSHEVRLC